MDGHKQVNADYTIGSRPNVLQNWHTHYSSIVIIPVRVYVCRSAFQIQYFKYIVLLYINYLNLRGLFFITTQQRKERAYYFKKNFVICTQSI